jgi:tRNA A37 threonylcarbamoyladenosine modification protein TsaB
VPIIDAKRGEIFALLDGEPRCLSPDELELVSGTLCVGDGALRYRSSLEELGAVIPPDESDQHVPRARFHALLARDFGPAEAIEPLYLRLPDAERRRS